MELYLAPIRGITDQIFRNVFARHFPGFDRAIAPFIAVGPGCSVKPSVLADLAPERETGIPTVPQVLTGSATGLIQISSPLFDMGHSCVNWNLGCPHRKVTKKNKGAGLLPHPEKIDEILENAMPRFAGRLSIKMRLGLDSADEIAQLLPILNRYPIEEVIIHPRTAAQIYTGTVDLDSFALCQEISEHRVVFSGDIISVPGLTELTRRFPDVHHWMIGRGALRDPFLVPSIKQEKSFPRSQRSPRLAEFHDELFELYSQKFSGPAHLLDRMKAIWSHLCFCFANGETIAKRIKKTNSIPRYQSFVRSVFDSAQ